MITQPLSETAVLGYIYFMERFFGMSVHSSLEADSPIVLIDRFLSSFGVIDPGAYRSRFAVTLGTTVYLPCALGSTDRWSWESQIITVGHEATHVEQFTRARTLQGATEFSWDYVTNPESRAWYEAEAYSAGDEIGYQLFGREPDPDWVAESLRAYHCDDDSRAFARDFCARRGRVTKAGGYSSMACKAAVTYWSRWGSHEGSARADTSAGGSGGMPG